jgi:hypothetical protein
MKILSASNDRYVSLAGIFFFHDTARFGSICSTRDVRRPKRPRSRKLARAGPTEPPALVSVGLCSRRERASTVTRSSVDLPLDCDATVIGRR